MAKLNSVLKNTRSFLQWTYKLDDIDIRKLDYEFITELEFWHRSVQHSDHNTTMKYIACVKKMALRDDYKWFGNLYRYKVGLTKALLQFRDGHRSGTKIYCWLLLGYYLTFLILPVMFVGSF